jgi:hypothetical protein
VASISRCVRSGRLGRIVRTINIPTLAVLLVQPALRPRFAFTPAVETQVAGRTAWAVGFEERLRPTLVRTIEGADLPMSGTLWVEPVTGIVLKTSMSVADTRVLATVAVEFREDPVLDLWVPGEMTEYYKATTSSDEIRCTATYRNYRKFSVATDEEIEKPPPEMSPPAKKALPAKKPPYFSQAIGWTPPSPSP